MKIKTDKHRNCVSMMAEGISDTNEYLFRKESTFQEYEENYYLDSHHLNRRKSCHCTCCGGLDSQQIRRVDKQAMDLLKLAISPTLKKKYHSNYKSSMKLRRQNLERWDEHDEPIKSQFKRFNFVKKPRIVKKKPIEKKKQSSSSDSQEMDDQESLVSDYCDLIKEESTQKKNTSGVK